MRWVLGGCVVVSALVACGGTESKPKPSGTGGASGGQASSGGQAGGTSAGNAQVGGGSGSGAGSSAMGECNGTTNQIAGTQLKRRFWVTAEGDKGFDSFWDPKLNGSCSFNRAIDGKMRCIPNNWSGSNEYFSDAGCTQAVYERMQDAPCAERDYIMVSVNGSCELPSGYDFYELGTKLDASAPVYRMPSGGACEAVSRPPGDLFAKGAQVPASTFLEGTPDTDFEGTSRLRTWGALGADGTRSVWGWHDTALDGMSCFLEEAEDGKQRCLPSGFADGFSDAACSEPVIVESLVCDKPYAKPYVAQSVNPSCAGVPKIFARSDELTGGVYKFGADSCEMETPPRVGKVYATVPVEPTRFEETTWLVDENDPGRLKPRYWVGGSGGCWFDSFIDTELGVPCHFATTGDGKTRCIPGNYFNGALLYTDAECSEVAAFAPLDDCLAASLPKYVSTTTYGTCARSYRVWKTGATVKLADLPPLWRGAGASCVPATPDAESYLSLEAISFDALLPAEASVE